MSKTISEAIRELSLSERAEFDNILKEEENAVGGDGESVAQAGITDSRDYIRLECDACGATLPRAVDPECEYCGAKYAKVRRYNGPELIIDVPHNINMPMFGETYGSSSYSTCQAYAFPETSMAVIVEDYDD